MPDNMTEQEKKLNKLNELLKMMDDGLTKEEFTKSFQNLVSVVLKTEKEISDKNNKAISDLIKLFEKLKDNLTSSTNSEIAKTIQQLKGLADKTFKEQQDGLNFIKDKVGSLKDGKDADDKVIVKNVLSQMPKIELKAETLRDKLENLRGDERIDISAIRGLEEKLKKRDTGASGLTIFGGSRPLQIQESGTVKEKTARFINFTGASVSRSADGVVTVAVASNVETPTGAVDGANTTYTVLHTPKYITLDGQMLYEGYGYSLSGLTVTTDIAPNTIIRSHF